MRWSRRLWIWVPGLIVLGLATSVTAGTAETDEQILKAAGISSDGSSLINLFRKQTRLGANGTRIEALIRQLGDDAYTRREQASSELVAIGIAAVPRLKQAVSNPDPEIAQRARVALQRIDDRDGTKASVLAAAARLLAARHSDGAAEVLLAFLPMADDEELTQAVRESLGTLAVRAGKPEPALLAALEDMDPVRRAAAAFSLCRAGLITKLPALRERLRDPSPAVRFPVAVALLQQHDAGAVDVLIPLLAELPLPQAAQVEDALRNLAGGLAPTMPLGNSPANAQICRDAWAKWWKTHDGDALLTYFRRRIPAEGDREKFKTALARLDRETPIQPNPAVVAAAGLGPAIIPSIRESLLDASEGMQLRLLDCLNLVRKTHGGGPDAACGALRLLCLRRPADAVETLLKYAPFAEDEAVAEELYNTLAVLAGDPATVKLLTAALTDEAPARRTAAAVVLARLGADHRPAVRKLLTDADPDVRMRTALALAFARDAEAVPVLVALLGELPQGQGWQVEDALRRLAGDTAPTAVLGADEASRHAARDAWAKWWQDNRGKVDFARLDGATRLLGYTMVVLLDQNRVMEMDARGRTRWYLDDLSLPLDVQMVEGDRILVAEHNANRVTERNLQGAVLWEKRIEGPLVAQRLPNGNTFIATRYQLVEVDRSGREVFARSGADETFMRAQRLPNGEILCVLSNGSAQRCVRYDSRGKEELSAFPVSVQTYGGRLDVLPGGGLLIPQHAADLLIEYDTAGKAVHQYTVAAPVAAVRLLNGNTLVTSMRDQKAVELDPAGREVWQYSPKTRVTRAWRR